MLHITNGDCAVEVLRKAGMKGETLPWRDVLHEGPVDARLPLEAHSKLRAEFIASAGFGSKESAEKQFAERDAALRGSATHEEVVLWFEHDLYDQLQLIQVLAWLAVHPHPKLTLVCEPEYLGSMAPARAADLFRARKAVTREELQAGLAAWAAFGSSDSRQIELFLQKPVPLRFLGAALRRLLEEYPWTNDGLSRLERQALESLRGGPLPFRELFPRAHHHREDPVFLGDSVLEWHLHRMAREGLLVQKPQWSLTAMGSDVLEGRSDAWTFRRAPRWLGGVQVSDGRPRWDPASARLV